VDARANRPRAQPLEPTVPRFYLSRKPHRSPPARLGPAPRSWPGAAACASRDLQRQGPSPLWRQSNADRAIDPPARSRSARATISAAREAGSAAGRPPCPPSACDRRVDQLGEPGQPPPSKRPGPSTRARDDMRCNAPQTAPPRRTLIGHSLPSAAAGRPPRRAMSPAMGPRRRLRPSDLRPGRPVWEHTCVQVGARRASARVADRGQLGPVIA